MMKTLFTVLTGLIFLFPGYSQQSKEVSKYTAFIEGGSIYFASSVFASVERRLASDTSKITHLYGRLGAGFVEVRDSQDWSPGLMAAITALIGKSGPHYAEITGGITIGDVQGSNENTGFAIPVFHFGYRYQTNQKLLFRAKIGLLGVGVGLGYAF